MTIHDFVCLSLLSPQFVGKGAKEDAKADDPKAGADVGKIVNLMAGDAGKVSTHFAIPPILQSWAII